MSAERRQPDEARATRLKAAMLEGWQHLSPEDQAAMIVEQLRGMFQTEGSSGLPEALRSAQLEPDPLLEVFPVTGVSRADLKERLQYSDEMLQELDDAAMREIAGKLEDAYVEHDFWDHLEIAADAVLAGKHRLSTSK